jgi:hypothetical protein
VPHELIKNTVYRQLLTDIRGEMERGIRRVEEFVERQKVLSYWSIGRKINVYLTTHEMAHGTIGRFYHDLSHDLQIHDRTLQQCEQFFRYFLKSKLDPQIRWSHYRCLLVESDPAKRQAWIARIKKEKMAPEDLRLALLPPVARDITLKLDLKNPPRGRLYTYRILRAEDIDTFDIPWFVDISFAGRREAPPSKAVLDNKYLYTSKKLMHGYTLKASDAKVSDLFTFVAQKRRIIDGDTLLVEVDQGFGCWTEQRLRLIGIDAPEMSTRAGVRAKKWLENELRNCPMLVVKTYKSDNWDRYLVDIFYIPKETDMVRVAKEGIWLNGRMVEAGIAKVWNANHPD